MDATLHIPDPDWSQPGPSRTQRPVAVSTAPYPMASPSSSSSRKRATHQITTSSHRDRDRERESAPAVLDVYNHPAAIAFMQAHPRRQIPKFGPYLLLQTLGEGEFGKVKLGLHTQWGEEVAVKLIRRGNVENPLRMSKVEREIEVLKLIKHPNIVRLYDVIETDKYIGIILEYASGGELFDHILAHRYLKEKDACKLFAQLISGVAYIHSKKIVHRDLKLENLLLDRHRNVIITDFGFANHFEHRADDLMQTSCGSPCYAAPELVVSEGLYVGSAVDIWSCGVILYAMLAGYLPFDDDPANPEGDNINLLYRYIMSTPLTFPDYVSTDARELLLIMLVPDPKHRAGLTEIMAHRWLSPYAHLFKRTVEELEQIAVEQQNAKRQAYQRQMRERAQAQQGDRERQEQSTPGRRVVASAIVWSSAAAAEHETEQFVDAIDAQTEPTPTPAPTPARSSRRSKSKESSSSKRAYKEKEKVPTTPKSSGGQKKGGYRHTVQLEYPEEPVPPQAHPFVGDVEMTADEKLESPTTPRGHKANAASGIEETITSTSPKTPKQQTPASFEALFTPPPPKGAAAPAGSQEVNQTYAQAELSTKPTRTPSISSQNTGSGSSRRRHGRGISLDKFGFAKLLGSGSPSNTANNASATEEKNGVVALNGVENKKANGDVEMVMNGDETEKEKDQGKENEKEGMVKKSKSRRKTLSLMVEPLSRTLKDRASRNRSVTVETTKSREKEGTPSQEIMVTPATPSIIPPNAPPSGGVINPTPAPVVVPSHSALVQQPLSSKSVMSWFRWRSLGKKGAEPPIAVEKPPVQHLDSYVGAPAASSSSTIGQAERDLHPQVIVTTPAQDEIDQQQRKDKESIKETISPVSSSNSRGRWSRTPSESTTGRGLVNLVKTVTSPRHIAPVVGNAATANGKFDALSLRIHHGAVDQAMITNGSPPIVFAHVARVLQEMGLEMQKDSEYKFRCIRPKRGALAVVGVMGSAASNGVDKRGLPMPSHAASGAGGMLRGLLMRRQSSQVSGHSVAPSTPPGISTSFDTEPDSSILSEAPVTAPVVETIYGDRSVDQGGEVRFSVELTRIDRLEDTLSLDIRRLKGDLRSYKFLYDTLRERCEFGR